MLEEACGDDRLELRQAVSGKGGNMKKSAIFLVVVLTTIVLFAGCGSSGSGSSLEGKYKLEIDGTTAVIILKANNKATYSLIDDGSGMPVTYKVKDGTVVLIGANGKEIANASYKIEPDGLRDSVGSLYKKQ